MSESAKSETSEHDEVVLLLPWYANETLAAGERERVRAHVATCGRCAAALRDDEVIRRAIAAPLPAPMINEVGLARLKQRIRSGNPDGAAQTMAPTASRRRLAGRPALVAAALLAIAAPIALTVALGGSGKHFRTLASDQPSAIGHQANDIRIVFGSSLTPAQRQALLAPYDGVVVDGPNSVGAYVVRLQAVEPDPAALQRALDLLRQQQAVLMAESIAPGIAP